MAALPKDWTAEHYSGKSVAETFALLKAKDLDMFVECFERMHMSGDKAMFFEKGGSGCNALGFGAASTPRTALLSADASACRSDSFKTPASLSAASSLGLPAATLSERLASDCPARLAAQCPSDADSSSATSAVQITAVLACSPRRAPTPITAIRPYR